MASIKKRANPKRVNPKRPNPKRPNPKRPTASGVTLAVERGPHRGVVRAEIVRRVQSMIMELQLQDREISFLLTDDERIHQLNKIYRHKDRPTDVLAFAMHEGDLAELAGPVLGDVIVSVPTARAQAREHGATLVDELTMLLAHGLLHLLGWDHRTAAEDRRMRAETDRLCVAAGGEPVRPGAGGEPARQRTAAEAARSKPGAARALTRKPTARGRRSGSEKDQEARQFGRQR